MKEGDSDSYLTMRSVGTWSITKYEEGRAVAPSSIQ